MVLLISSWYGPHGAMPNCQTMTPEHEINLPKVLENVILKLRVWILKLEQEERDV